MSSQPASSSGARSDGSTIVPTPSPVPAPAGSVQPIPVASAPMPTNIANGTTVSLSCGTTYYGSLNLSGKSNVTINTSGACGPAVITPAVSVSGWSRSSGNIYVANVATEVAQVFVDSQLMGMAHYPNSFDESGWLQPSSVTSTSVNYSGLPSNDIVGAKATYRGTWQWAIGSRTVAAYDGTTISLPANTNPDLASEDCDLGKFYLEGKLWMLDSPGEWAWSNGKLYVWMPDGAEPGVRVQAAPKVDATIDATGATNVTIDHVRVFGGSIGINGSKSTSLHILNSEISFSDWVGVYATNASGLNITNSDIIGSLHTGVYARYGSSSSTITGSRFTNVNMVGMHKGSDGTIYLSGDKSATVSDNIVTNSGKSGIFLGSSLNSFIKNNTVDGACRIHGDCGGIYVIDRSKVVLNTRIEGNKVSNVNGAPVYAGSSNPERYGIYLDDYSTGVTVIGNTFSNNDTGLLLHGAADNSITGNSFSGNIQRHIYLSENALSSGVMHGNAFTNNTLVGPVLGYQFQVANPVNAATYSGNIYNNYNTSPIGSPSNLPY